MATKLALTVSPAPIVTLSRGRSILVAALYPAHPYAPRTRLEARRKVQSHSSSTVVADRKPAQGAVSANPEFRGLHHVGILVQDLDRSLDFYCGILGLEVNPDRPDSKLPYAGAWLWIGPEMIHLMVLPNPDPLDGRPEHGGRDRHCCIGIASLPILEERLTAANIPFTRSKSGRPAVFFRDPDMNVLEVVESGQWR